MAGKNEIKASVRLEGGSTFKKDITDVNKNLKQLDAESKKVSAEFDGQANSLQALTAKQKVLNQTLEEAQRKVQLFDSRIKDLEGQQKSIADATEKYRSELKDAQAALSHMDKGTDAYRDQAAAVEDLSRKVALGEKNQERAADQIQKYKTEQTQAQTAVAKLNREIDDNAKYLKEAENASDQCATSIDEYGHKVKDASEKSKDLGDVAKVALGNLAADAASKLADAAVDAAKAMVEVGSNFEAAMSEVEAISGASGSNLDAMSAKAKELSSTTKFTATDVANGFKYMSLAGWDTAQMLSAIDGVVNLAAASDMDLAEASDMVTDYLSAFGLQASDSAKMVDEMVFAQSHSNTSTKQLGEAFGNCAANMNAAGQSMETTVAVLEAMANQGTKGSQAGTQLAAVMRDITSKMKNGAIQIGKTSVQVKDSEGNYRDLIDILADVEAATKGMGSADKAAALQKTFTARSIKAVNQVLNEGTGKIKGYRDALDDSGGAAAKTASTMMDNFKGAMTEASSAAEGLGIALFEKVSKPKGLTADGIKTAAGSDFWLASTLRKILRNEKYIGDALLQKTITTDFLTKKRVANKGIVPQYYVEGSHEAIIPKELYMMVQEEMVRRANLETGTGKKRIYSGKYALSSIVFCAHCGDVFQRTHWNVHGRKKIVWRCVSRLHKKDRDFDCPARTVTETDLHAAVVAAVNEVHAHQDAYLPQLKINIEKALSLNNNGPVAELDVKIADLEQEILKRTRAMQECDDLGKEVIRLREEKYQLQLEDASKETLRQKIVELETVLAGINGKVEEYEDALVRKLIERITVYDDYFTVEFKSGIEIDVRL